MKKRVLSMMLVLVMILTASLTTGVEITFATEYDGWQEGLELLEGDTVVIDGNSYAYGGDASGGLNMTSNAGPDVNTIWTAGAGYVLFHYAGEGDSRVVTITLHDATIEKTGESTDDALQLPSAYAVKMLLEGENHITTNGDGIDDRDSVNGLFLEISGAGSLDIKASGYGLSVRRPTVLKSGTVLVEATGVYPAIQLWSTSATSFTVEGGTLVAKAADNFAFCSYSGDLTITGGNVTFANTAGGDSIEMAGDEGSKFTVSDAKVDMTGDIRIYNVEDVTDMSRYADIADTVTGTIFETSVMLIDGENKYAKYDADGTLIKSGVVQYDFNYEEGYNEDATLETEGYTVEWIYDDTDVKVGYKLTIGKALQATLILPENLSGTIVVAEDVEYQDFFQDLLFVGMEGSSDEIEPITITITGPGSIKTDMDFGFFADVDLILQEIDITTTAGLSSMGGGLKLKDVTYNFVGEKRFTGLGSQGAALTIENSEIYMENVEYGILVFGEDAEIIDSEITIVCREDASSRGIFVQSGELEINKSVVSISKAKTGIDAAMSEDHCQMVIKDSDVTVEAKDFAIHSVNKIVIDNSNCNLQVSRDDGMAIMSYDGITIQNVLNADDVEVGEFATGYYTILANGNPVKAVKIETLAVSELVVEKTKTEYKVGDTLNLDDITVTAKYNDGTSKAVTTYTTNASALDMSVAGDKTLTISYTEDGKTVTKDITIVVAAKVVEPPTTEPPAVEGTGDVSQNGYTLLLMFAAAALVAVCAKKRFAK